MSRHEFTAEREIRNSLLRGDNEEQFLATLKDHTRACPTFTHYHIYIPDTVLGSVTADMYQRIRELGFFSADYEHYLEVQLIKTLTEMGD